VGGSPGCRWFQLLPYLAQDTFHINQFIIVYPQHGDIHIGQHFFPSPVLILPGVMYPSVNFNGQPGARTIEIGNENIQVIAIPVVYDWMLSQEFEPIQLPAPDPFP